MARTAVAVVDRLAEFVAIKSVSGGEAALADRIGAILQDAGMAPQRNGRNVWARRGEGGPCLRLNSHIDTVPAVEGWTSDPWTPRIEDGSLFGRGASEAKASVAAMLEGFLTAPMPARGSLLFAATCDEETGGGGRQEVWAARD